MIILDENITKNQRQLLTSWRIRTKQIGLNTGWSGMQDEEVIPLLLQLRRPTFFTRDDDFYERQLCHTRYCLVYLAIELSEVAIFVRRLIRHPDFDTQAKRLGKVMRITHAGISFWHLHGERELFIEWP